MKFKSKSLISIILSIMMVMSMILVAIPANAAVVDSEPVGADAYYLWYQESADNPDNFTNKVELVSAGNNLYEASITVTTPNYHSAIVNQNAKTAADNNIWSTEPTVSKDSALSGKTNYVQGSDYSLDGIKYGLVKFSVKNENVPLALKFTFNSSDKSMSVSEGSSTPATKHTVSSDKTSNGSFIVSPTSAAKDTEVTVTTKPDSGYEVDTVTYTPEGGSAITVPSSNNTYKFKMPDANVKVNVTFKASSTPSTSYYVTGRFRVKDESGNPTQIDWNPTNMTDPFKFQPVEGKSGVYSLDTNCTLKELSEKISCTNSNNESYDAYQFFFIYDGTNKYNADNIKLQNVTESNPQTLKTGGQNEDMRFSAESDTSTDKVTLMLDTNNGLKLWYTTDGATTTKGAFTITDKTELNGSLTFSAEGKTAGTADAGNTVNVKAKPYAGFTCSGITVTYTDTTTKAKVTIPATGSGNSYEFVVPSDLTTTVVKNKEISVAATFTLDKAAYIASQGDGLWIDVAPDENDSTATLIKWNNYSGSNHETTSTYIFYVPKNVDLTNANIYNGYGSAVTLNGTSIPADGTAVVSLAKDITYATSDGVRTNVKVMQGSTNAMFLYTTKGDAAYSLPTNTGAGETKDSVKSDGGSCKTMTDTTDTAKQFSAAMALDSVKGRGNSSWEASNKLFGKYAFNMKLAKKTNLFNIDTTKLPDGSKPSGSKSWCLLANNADESMLRNALTYQLASEIGLLYSPEFSFVDIYDNGEYLGSYLVTEKVDVGNSKLVKGESFDDINEKAANKNVDEGTKRGEYTYNDTQYKMQYANVLPSGSDTSAIDYNKKGKYLLEFEIKTRLFPKGESNTSSEASWFRSPRGQYVVVKSPEFATKEQVEFIATKFAAMEAMIFTSDNTSTAKKSELSTVMDVESFAKMYLIQEFSSNLDAASTSYYITFDCAQTNPVFVANPVWDYDWAYGQYSNDSKKPVSGNGQDEFLQTNNPEKWVAKYKSMDDSTGGSAYSIQSILASKNSEFKSVIRKVWEEKGGFYDTIKKYYGTDSQIDTWYSLIADSVNINETRWGFIKNDPIFSWKSNDTGDTHADAVKYLENTWTATRAAWLNEQFTTTPEYKTYTPDVPTIMLCDANGNAISAVEQGKGFIIKVTSPVENNVVYRFFTSNGTQVDADQSDGILEIATDGLTVGETYTYKVQAVYNGKASDYSNTVSITIDDKAGNKQVTIYFKSASASAYVPSLSVDGSAPEVMTRNKKGEANSTYFGSTYSGSLKFYWFYTTMTLDTSVAHTLVFTTKDNRVNAKISYTFSAAEDNKYYFAVDNLMGDTNLVYLTGEKEYIRNYHISATHMVHSTTYDNNVGFTWINGKEWAMGTYIKDHVNTASLTDLTSSSLLTIPSALTPNAMLEASSAPAFFTIKSATLAQRISAEAEEVSTLQYQLLDVNLDGKVDVKDSTMMQKALAGF